MNDQMWSAVAWHVLRTSRAQSTSDGHAPSPPSPTTTIQSTQESQGRRSTDSSKGSTLAQRITAFVSRRMGNR
jgi:hypothetical protein